MLDLPFLNPVEVLGYIKPTPTVGSDGLVHLPNGNVVGANTSASGIGVTMPSGGIAPASVQITTSPTSGIVSAVVNGVQNVTSGISNAIPMAQAAIANPIEAYFVNGFFILVFVVLIYAFATGGTAKDGINVVVDTAKKVGAYAAEAAS